MSSLLSILFAVRSIVPSGQPVILPDQNCSDGGRTVISRFQVRKIAQDQAVRLYTAGQIECRVIAAWNQPGPNATPMLLFFWIDPAVTTVQITPFAQRSYQIAIPQPQLH